MRISRRYFALGVGIVLVCFASLTRLAVRTTCPGVWLAARRIRAAACRPWWTAELSPAKRRGQPLPASAPGIELVVSIPLRR